jgi:hypothetical protein
MKKKLKVIVFTLVLISISASMALAFTEPSSGSFGYEIYEFLDSNIGTGLSVVIALGIMAYCIYFILRSNLFGAIPCAVAALMLVKIKDIVFSLGAMWN